MNSPKTSDFWPIHLTLCNNRREIIVSTWIAIMMYDAKWKRSLDLRSTVGLDRWGVLIGELWLAKDVKDRSFYIDFVDSFCISMSIAEKKHKITQLAKSRYSGENGEWDEMMTTSCFTRELDHTPFCGFSLLLVSFAAQMMDMVEVNLQTTESMHIPATPMTPVGWKILRVCRPANPKTKDAWVPAKAILNTNILQRSLLISNIFPMNMFVYASFAWYLDFILYIELLI